MSRYSVLCGSHLSIEDSHLSVMSCSWISMTIIFVVEEMIVCHAVRAEDVTDATDDDDDDDDSSDRFAGGGFCKDGYSLTQWLKWFEECLCFFFKCVLIDHVW